MDYLDKTIKHILYQYEGGGKLVNNPNDPGGLTKWGISSRAHPDLDIENLSFSGAKKVIKNTYAKPIMFYEVCLINPLLAVYMLDFSIHSGARRAIKTLQELVKTSADGFMGPNTLEAIKISNHTDLPQRFLSKRLSFLSRTSVFTSFRDGFINRIMHLSSLEVSRL